MKKSFFMFYMFYISFLMLNFDFLSAMEQPSKNKLQPNKKKVHSYTIDIQKLNRSSLFKKNTRTIAQLIKSQENLICKTNIDNEDYVSSIVTIPFLVRVNKTLHFNLAQWECLYHKFHLDPLLTSLQNKTSNLENLIKQIEKDNENIKEQYTLLQKKNNQPTPRKKYSLFTGAALFFTGIGVHWAWNHFNIGLDFCTFFNRISSAILEKK